MGFPVKNPPANTGDIRDTGLIPGSRRSPGGGHGIPLQSSCLERHVDRGAWRSAVLGVAESDTTGATTHTHTLRVGLVPASADQTSAKAGGAGASPCPPDRATPSCPQAGSPGCGAEPTAAQSQQLGPGVQARGLQGGGASASVPMRVRPSHLGGARGPTFITQPRAPPLCHARPSSQTGRCSNWLTDRKKDFTHPFIHSFIHSTCPFIHHCHKSPGKHTGALPFSLSQEVS